LKNFLYLNINININYIYILISNKYFLDSQQVDLDALDQLAQLKL